MAKILALLFIVCAGTLNTVGHFWFGYGIWPKSWAALFTFTLLSWVLAVMMSAVIKSDD